MRMCNTAHRAHHRFRRAVLYAADGRARRPGRNVRVPSTHTFPFAYFTAMVDRSLTYYGTVQTLHMPAGGSAACQ